MIQDMLNTVADTQLRVWERVCDQIQIDILFVHEDMAGKNGPMMGPDHVQAFIVPYYRRVWNSLKSRGVRLFDQDSDGDIRVLIPAFLEAGVNCMHPMEPGSHMDLVTVRETYGDKLAFYGGLDKHVLRESKQDILSELERKIPPMLNTGGCVLALDHRIPNGTPLENYRYYIQTVWEMLEG